MALTVTGVTPAIFGTEGGTELEITGTFTIGVPLEVRVGGILCYGGPGFGTSPQSSNGTKVIVAAPPLETGSHPVTVKEGVDTVPSPSEVNVIDRAWSSKVFSVRSSFPSWYGVGKRRLDLEPKQ